MYIHKLCYTVRMERTTAIRVKPSTARVLRTLAAQHGYIQRQGVQAGAGSIRLLLEAIEEGDLVVRSTMRSPRPDGANPVT